MTGPRLLVIDDEPQFGEYVRHVAMELGFDVMVTTRGEDFKEAFVEFPPDVVMLDMVMPEPDGTELMLWLAERRATAAIVIVTGFDALYASIASRLGIGKGLREATILTKPIPLAVLRRVLIEAVDGAR